MNKAPTKNPRNLGVMVISGTLTLLFGMLAVYFFGDTQTGSIFIPIGCVVIALMCLGVFIYGRKEALGYLAEAIISIL